MVIVGQPSGLGRGGLDRGGEVWGYRIVSMGTASRYPSIAGRISDGFAAYFLGFVFGRNGPKA